MRRQTLGHVAVLLSLCVVGTAGQRAPYFGTWTLVPDKSDFGPVQITFAEKGSGQYMWTDDLSKRSYMFKIDGKSHQDPYGMSAVWTQQGPRRWRVITTANGKQVAVETYDLSPDGRSLTDHVEAPTMNQTQDITMTRVGGGDGLTGTWKGNFRQSAFDLDIQPTDAGGLIYRLQGAFEVTAMFDGKPAPMTGPLLVNPLTAAFTRVDPSSFRTLQKEGERTTADLTLTASSDGKTLTMTGTNEAGKVSALFTRKK